MPQTLSLSPCQAHLTNIDHLIPRGKSIETELVRDHLLKVLHSSGEVLPPSSSPLGRLWRLVNEKTSSLQDCVDTIKLDAALTARIFRVANSVVNAGRSGVSATSLDDAVSRIGYSQLRELVFSSGVLGQFSKLVMPPGWESFWLRNLLVARLTERISSHFFKTNGTEYLAGLLHDSGLAFLAAFFPKEFAQIFSGDVFYLDKERSILPASHAAISAAICARSLLPLRVVNAVAYHHHPTFLNTQIASTVGQSAQFLGTILNVADMLADYCELGIGNAPLLSLEEIARTPEAIWLNGFGTIGDYHQIVSEELKTVEKTFSIFWPDSAK